MRKQARLVVAVFGVAFAVFVALQFKRRAAARPPDAVVRTDPRAVVETTAGTSLRITRSREDVHVQYQQLLTYQDGSNKFVGVTITVPDRDRPDRRFTITAKEGKAGQNESDIALDGDVRLEASDGLAVRTEHATYTDSDGAVHAPGPVTFSKGRMSGTGVGVRYDKTRDLLSILSQAVVKVSPDEKGGGVLDVSAGSAGLARREHYMQFDGAVRIGRGSQTIESDAAVARLSEDEKRVEKLELHNNSRITGTAGGPGSLRSLSGADMTLEYADDGEALKRVLVFNEAVIQMAGEAGQAGRQIAAKTLDIGMAPDGSTPVSLSARENVEVTFPPEGSVPGRVIRSASLEGKGEPGRGITRASFVGGVQFREKGAKVDRAASSTSLDLAMKPGMGAIEEARFAHAVRFEEGTMSAQAAAARYDVTKGSLELSGSEAGFLTPRMVNDRIDVNATTIDLTLEGPIIDAEGAVKSTLKPAKKDSGSETKLPSMLKADQPVSVLGDALAYDGVKSLATYTGNARLFQGSDTSMKADTISIDEKSGDMTATGKAMTTTTREQTRKDGKTKDRVQSTATSQDVKYEDAERRLTYTGAAHMVGPEGDMTATRIELYLKPGGDELDRAEAYADAGTDDKLTLREQSRTTTGKRMTYTADKELYVVNGLPATILDECGRETIGRTLTFTRATDTIVVDGNQQIRTQTKGGGAGKCQ